LHCSFKKRISVVAGNSWRARNSGWGRERNNSHVVGKRHGITVAADVAWKHWKKER
jgi:hypothetical protein